MEQYFGRLDVEWLDVGGLGVGGWDKVMYSNGFGPTFEEWVETKRKK